jgi:hypothetical protein
MFRLALRFKLRHSLRNRLYGVLKLHRINAEFRLIVLRLLGFHSFDHHIRIRAIGDAEGNGSSNSSAHPGAATPPRRGSIQHHAACPQLSIWESWFELGGWRGRYQPPALDAFPGGGGSRGAPLHSRKMIEWVWRGSSGPGTL